MWSSINCSGSSWPVIPGSHALIIIAPVSCSCSQSLAELLQPRSCHSCLYLASANTIRLHQLICDGLREPSKDFPSVQTSSPLNFCVPLCFCGVYVSKTASCISNWCISFPRQVEFSSEFSELTFGSWLHSFPTLHVGTRIAISSALRFLTSSAIRGCTSSGTLDT